MTLRQYTCRPATTWATTTPPILEAQRHGGWRCQGCVSDPFLEPGYPPPHIRSCVHLPTRSGLPLHQYHPAQAVVGCRLAKRRDSFCCWAHQNPKTRSLCHPVTSGDSLHKWVEYSIARGCSHRDWPSTGCRQGKTRKRRTGRLWKTKHPGRRLPPEKDRVVSSLCRNGIARREGFCHRNRYCSCPCREWDCSSGSGRPSIEPAPRMDGETARAAHREPKSDSRGRSSARSGRRKTSHRASSGRSIPGLDIASRAAPHGGLTRPPKSPIAPRRG